MKKVLSLFLFLAIVWGVAIFIGGEIGLQSRTVTAWMSKSFWGEPYGPLSISWALLFGLVGLAGWIVWEKAVPEERTLPMLAFCSQLIATIICSYSEAYLPLLAGLLLFTMGTFWFHSKWAAILIIPYFTWILFSITMSLI